MVLLRVVIVVVSSCGQVTKKKRECLRLEGGGFPRRRHQATTPSNTNATPNDCYHPPSLWSHLLFVIQLFLTCLSYPKATIRRTIKMIRPGAADFVSSRYYPQQRDRSTGTKVTDVYPPTSAIMDTSTLLGNSSYAVYPTPTLPSSTVATSPYSLGVEPTPPPPYFDTGSGMDSAWYMAPGMEVPYYQHHHEESHSFSNGKETYVPRRSHHHQQDQSSSISSSWSCLQGQGTNASQSLLISPAEEAPPLSLETRDSVNGFLSKMHRSKLFSVPPSLSFLHRGSLQFEDDLTDSLVSPPPSPCRNPPQYSRLLKYQQPQKSIRKKKAGLVTSQPVGTASFQDSKTRRLWSLVNHHDGEEKQGDVSMEEQQPIIAPLNWKQLEQQVAFLVSCNGPSHLAVPTVPRPVETSFTLPLSDGFYPQYFCEQQLGSQFSFHGDHHSNHSLNQNNNSSYANVANWTTHKDGYGMMHPQAIQSGYPSSDWTPPTTHKMTGWARQ